MPEGAGRKKQTPDRSRGVEIARDGFRYIWGWRPGVHGSRLTGTEEEEDDGRELPLRPGTGRGPGVFGAFQEYLEALVGVSSLKFFPSDRHKKHLWFGKIRKRSETFGKVRFTLI